MCIFTNQTQLHRPIKGWINTRTGAHEVFFVLHLVSAHVLICLIVVPLNTATWAHDNTFCHANLRSYSESII